MDKSNRDTSLVQAEIKLTQASAALDLYGSLERTPESELQAFEEACNCWLWAQVFAANQLEAGDDGAVLCKLQVGAVA